MKNIHILPTDKPSRLVKFFTNKLHLCKEILPIQDEEQYQNIYITSDEEIKQGDWCIYKTGEIIHYLVKLNIDNLKKIILTTDQDLIKDGVQAIDDEFLEWFVNNPSCEEVEVEREMYMPQSNGKISDGKITHEISLDSSQNTLPYYKIIIPKEEPKQELPIVNGSYGCTIQTKKQETLEEEFKFKNRQMGAAGFVGNKIMENMISKFKQETLEDITLEEVFGSEYCQFSVVENKLAILYRNQEQLLKAIKLLSNEK